MSRYYAYLNNSFQGPIATEELASLVRKKIITIESYVYDIEFKCTFQIGEISELSGFLPPPPAINPNEDYLIYRNLMIEGPYPLEMIDDMIKAKEITLYDFALHCGKQKWMRIKDFIIFQKYICKPPQFDSKINFENASQDRLLDKKSIREYPRAPYSARATINLNNQEYSGICTTLAMGGCYLETKIDYYTIGDEIQLHIFPDMIDLDILTKGIVISKHKENLKGIGVEFIELDIDIKNEIKRFVNRYIKMINNRD